MALKLAFKANTVKKKEVINSEFGLLIDKTIDDAGLKKKKVAEEAGIHPTSLSRIISGAGVERGTAENIISAINKLANREVVEKNAALGLLKFLPSVEDAERVELETMYRKRKKLSPARRAAFNRIFEMVDRELDRIYAEEIAENPDKAVR